MRRIIVFSLTFLYVLTSQVDARILYVDQQYAYRPQAFYQVNASLIGTDLVPLPTIQAAADLTRPGDSVLVKEGIYAGVTITHSGTAEKRILYQALVKGTVKVNGFLNIDGDYITVKDLYFDGAQAQAGPVIRGRDVKVLGNTDPDAKGTAVSTTAAPRFRETFPSPMTSGYVFDFTTDREITITIFDNQGTRVKSINGTGNQVIRWDGRDEQGGQAGPGTYFYRAQMGDEVKTGMILKTQ